jgi:hypothetical protein
LTHFFRAKGFILPQKPSFDFVGNGWPVAYVEESLALPEVLAEAGAAVGALVCGAPLAAAGALCAITGRPRLAASNIVAIDPGVTVLFITLVPLSARSSLGKITHRSLLYLPASSASYWPNIVTF